MLLGLRFGELFVLGFILIAVLGAPWFPRVGGAIAAAIAGKKPADRSPPP